MNAPTIGGMFDGSGMLALGLHQAGLRHRWLCEADPWRRELLRQRFPGVPVYADVRDIDASCERVDGIAGGFPCKGASTAGQRNGFDHPETALWREMRRAIGDLEPRFVVIENVANLVSIAAGALWGEVLADLAALGFDVEWDCLPAASVGAPHLRDRVFAVATHPGRQEQRRDVGCSDRPRQRADAGAAPADAPHAGSDRLRAEQEPERGRSSSSVSARAGEAPADSARDAQGGPGAQARPDGERAGPRAGGGQVAADVAVEWGEYAPAIQRWEAVHGAAPEPLVRRVDDGPADVRRLRARVDRSRLSALGDGVHVYVARLVGEHVMSLAGATTPRRQSDPKDPSA